MRRIVTVIGILAVLGIGVFVFFSLRGKTLEPLPIPDEKTENVGTHEVIGTSVQGRTIDAYTYGTGAIHLLFVGGIHGGYEWNSVLLAYQFMDFLTANPTIIPTNLTITVIPSANPDGVFKVVGKDGRFTSADVSSSQEVAASGRFNAHGVDLNRNFDCKWKSESTWRSQIVSAGTSAFSEPETTALRDFILKDTPSAVVFWHSQSNAVYASECEKGILPETLSVMNAYAGASGYPAVTIFDAYPITGDAEGWLASINIPAVTVELQTHETIEWERNLAGIKALFTLYPAVQ
ncbi:MAG: M14 family metallopeptidase [Candidatus Campbellbacteria bacterium]|nr:M14 family metallopeptidase [Candidatus Campbellbacteria bacterium]